MDDKQSCGHDSAYLQHACRAASHVNSQSHHASKPDLFAMVAFDHTAMPLSMLQTVNSATFSMHGFINNFV